MCLGTPKATQLSHLSCRGQGNGRGLLKVWKGDWEKVTLKNQEVPAEVGQNPSSTIL